MSFLKAIGIGTGPAAEDIAAPLAAPQRLNGLHLRRFFQGGLEALRRCAGAVNRLNVFPVPDGDTGSNMLATLASALWTVEGSCLDSLGAVAGESARGALLGARGNSGVILAQIFAGLDAVLGEMAEAGVRDWAAAWEVAARAAYRSVSVPVEGTALTVAREAATAAMAAADAGLPLLDAWRAMADAADAAVARTARLLPVLERAEVVDAGGLGLALILRGGLCAFTGEPLPDPDRLPAPSARTWRVIEESMFPRYCTELVLSGARVERSELEHHLRTLGDSLEVAQGGDGADSPLRIHLHTGDPEALFAYAATLGTVSHRKVEDMEAQRLCFLAGAEPVALGLLVVVPGAGWRRAFETLPGVVGVVERVPSSPLGTEELGAALYHAPARELLLLVNDPDLGPVALSAAESALRPVRVVPTLNAAEGIAAALAFNAATSLEDNLATMLESARGVRTTAVSQAPDGRADDRLLAVGNGSVEAVEAAIAALGGEIALVTLYYGAGIPRAEIDALASRLESRFPGVELEVVDGGQLEPALLLAVE